MIKGEEYKHIATFEDEVDAADKAQRNDGVIIKGRNKNGLVYRVYKLK